MEHTRAYCREPKQFARPVDQDCGYVGDCHAKVPGNAAKIHGDRLDLGASQMRLTKESLAVMCKAAWAFSYKLSTLLRAGSSAIALRIVSIHIPSLAG